MSEIDSNLVDEIVERQISCLYVVYAFVASLIIYFAWRSTYVRDYTQHDLYRRRTLFILNPQTGVFERHPIVLQSQGDSSAASTTTGTNNSGTSADGYIDGGHLSSSDIDNSNIVRLPAPPPTLESILDEVSGFTTGVHYNNPTALLETDVIEEEAQAIIRDMDSGVHTQEGLRQRRLAFFQNISGSNWTTTAATTASTASTSISAPTPSVSSVSEATVSVDLASEQKASATKTTAGINNDATDGTTSNAPAPAEASSPSGNHADEEFGDELTIKLKYLNDDLKIVKGRPSELIGDFKK